MLIELKDGKKIRIGKLITIKYKQTKIKFGQKGLNQEYNCIKYLHHNREVSFIYEYRIYAFYNHETCGFVKVCNTPALNNDFQSKHIGEIGYIFSKRFQGSGLPYFMVYYLAKVMHKRGIKILLASISSSNKKSIKFTENCGGTLVGIFKNTVKLRKGYEDNIWIEATTTDFINNSRNRWKQKGIKVIRI